MKIVSIKNAHLIANSALLLILVLSGFAGLANAQHYPNGQIETDLSSNIAYEFVNSSDYLYAKPDYISSSAFTHSSIKSYYNALLGLGKDQVPEPLWVPIGSGGITTFIPVYKVPKRVGDTFVQRLLILEQIKRAIGRRVIDRTSIGDETGQINLFYANTKRFAADHNLVFGQAFPVDKWDQNIYGDLIWPEFRDIQGQQVVVPIVHLTHNTIAIYKVSSHEPVMDGASVTLGSIDLSPSAAMELRANYVTIGEALECADAPYCSSGSLHVRGNLNVAETNLEIVVNGPLDIYGGTVSADKNLNIAAQSVHVRPVINVQRTKFGEKQVIGSLGKITGNDISLKAVGDIVLEAGEIEGKNISLDAEGNILIDSVALQSYERVVTPKWQRESSALTHVGSLLSAEENIELMAAGAIEINASTLHADEGHIKLLAGLGVSILDAEGVKQSVSHGEFGDMTVDESTYVTIAMRAVLDAGQGIEIDSKFGNIKLRATELSSVDGTSVTASSGAVEMLMAVENDHYSYTSVKETLFTITNISKGHEIQNAKPNTILGGFKAEAMYGVKVEYVPDSSLTFEQQVNEIASAPGMKWIEELRNDLSDDVDWSHIDLTIREWHEENTSLTPEFAALVSVAAGVVSGGTSFGLNGVWGAMATAGTSSLQSQFIMTMANGIVNGDLDGALEKLATMDTLQAAATAMVTAGVIHELDQSFFKPKPGDVKKLAEARGINNLVEGSGEYLGLVDELSALSFADQLNQTVVHSVAKSGINTFVQGGDLGDFGDAFAQTLAQDAVNQLGEYMAKAIGDAFDDPLNPEVYDKALKYISHAGAGCIVGVANANIENVNAESACAVSAGGAVVGEYIATAIRDDGVINAAQAAVDEFMVDNKQQIDYLKEFYGDDLTPDQLMAYFSPYITAGVVLDVNSLRTKGVDLARLGSAFAAFAAGADANGIDWAAEAGANSAENNAFGPLDLYLQHKFNLLMINAFNLDLSSKDGPFKKLIRKTGEAGMNFAVGAAQEMDEAFSEDPIFPPSLKGLDSLDDLDPQTRAAIAGGIFAGLMDSVSLVGSLTDASLRLSQDIENGNFDLTKQSGLNALNDAAKGITAAMNIDIEVLLLNAVHTIQDADCKDRQSQATVARLTTNLFLAVATTGVSSTMLSASRASAGVERSLARTAALGGEGKLDFNGVTKNLGFEVKQVRIGNDVVNDFKVANGVKSANSDGKIASGDFSVVVGRKIPNELDAVSKLSDSLAFRKRSLELATDPGRGQLLIREGIGAARFEQATGRTVTRSVDPATDFVDPKLGAFDLKGPLRANDGTPIDITPERIEGLGNSVVWEVNNSTASKAVVVDTLGLTKEQVSILKSQISNGIKNNKPIIFLE
ncbi:Possible hemagglutinin [Alteromonadaceae bacterium Bs31]|nr:Possible hemagglutinin [Alteromonadaceae bacterium Bs31]